jgi:hypothetical protein
MQSISLPARLSLAGAGLLLLGATGCGSSLVAVHGKVTYPDGKPLTAGLVVFESQGQEKAITARGEVRGDGTFELGTYQPGDGAPPGKYRALVTPKYDPNAVDRPARPPAFDERYSSFATSGLEFEVTASGPNAFSIQVSARPR